MHRIFRSHTKILAPSQNNYLNNDWKVVRHTAWHTIYNVVALIQYKGVQMGDEGRRHMTLNIHFHIIGRRTIYRHTMYSHRLSSTHNSLIHISSQQSSLDNLQYRATRGAASRSRRPRVRRAAYGCPYIETRLDCMGVVIHGVMIFGVTTYGVTTYGVAIWFDDA